jgi:8-oxo-dGTP diphosphatase
MLTTVDTVLLTIEKSELSVLLVRRDRAPFEGQLALPGGFLRPEEDADTLSAAQRVLRDKAGLVSPYLEQLYTFADGARDPRGWSISVAYFALLPRDALPSQSEQFELVPVSRLPRLAFDHNRIVEVARDRLRVKGAYSSLPAYLLPETFTLSELQIAYEIATESALNKAAFRRKLAELDIVAPTEELRSGAHRPARLYRLKAPQHLALFERTV